MPEPDDTHPEPPRQTLVQRMAQARERTAAARLERGDTVTALPFEAQPERLPGLQPSPMLMKPPVRSRPVLATSAGAPAAARAPAWEVPARLGENLMLMPGQMHFGSQPALLRTLLGSCVAVTLWHRQRRIGGMCHFLLPTRNRRADQALDGKYGDEALEVMVARLRAARTEPSEYEAHLYGGADTMPESSGVKFNVGERNIEQGWQLIDRYGFQLQGVDVGEDVPRTVSLNFTDGSVDMKRGHGRAPQPHLQAGPAVSARARKG